MSISDLMDWKTFGRCVLVIILLIGLYQGIKHVATQVEIERTSLDVRQKALEREAREMISAEKMDSYSLERLDDIKEQ